MFPRDRKCGHRTGPFFYLKNSKGRGLVGIACNSKAMSQGSGESSPIYRKFYGKNIAPVGQVGTSKVRESQAS